MAYLTINDKEFEARNDFKFIETADKKYAQRNEEGQVTQDGVRVIYSGLLEFDPLALAKYWDCALSHYKDKPSIEQIHEALLEQSHNGNVEPLVKDAFQVIDNAGFLKSRVNKFWNETEMAKDLVETDQQKTALKKQIKQMKEAREQLNS